MIYAQVTEKEQMESALKEAADAKWYVRLKIIDLSAEGFTVPQLAETLLSLPPDHPRLHPSIQYRGARWAFARLQSGLPKEDCFNPSTMGRTVTPESFSV